MVSLFILLTPPNTSPLATSLSREIAQGCSPLFTSTLSPRLDQTESSLTSQGMVPGGSGSEPQRFFTKSLSLVLDPPLFLFFINEELKRKKKKIELERKPVKHCVFFFCLFPHIMLSFYSRGWYGVSDKMSGPSVESGREDKDALGSGANAPAFGGAFLFSTTSEATKPPSGFSFGARSTDVTFGLPSQAVFGSSQSFGAASCRTPTSPSVASDGFSFPNTAPVTSHDVSSSSSNAATSAFDFSVPVATSGTVPVTSHASSSSSNAAGSAFDFSVATSGSMPVTSHDVSSSSSNAATDTFDFSVPVATSSFSFSSTKPVTSHVAFSSSPSAATGAFDFSGSRFASSSALSAAADFRPVASGSSGAFGLNKAFGASPSAFPCSGLSGFSYTPAAAPGTEPFNKKEEKPATKAAGRHSRVNGEWTCTRCRNTKDMNHAIKTKKVFVFCDHCSKDAFFKWNPAKFILIREKKPEKPKAKPFPECKEDPFAEMAGSVNPFSAVSSDNPFEFVLPVAFAAGTIPNYKKEQAAHVEESFEVRVEKEVQKRLAQRPNLAEIMVDALRPLTKELTQDAVDPVTLEPFIDPVVLFCGHVVDRCTVVKLHRDGKTPCPICRASHHGDVISCAAMEGCVTTLKKINEVFLAHTD
eukprot:TRINITY_DN703_c0_g1_i1.p1 TRINITY_DN703_c0_g1~~TRINITY_DN703_c0_g1_i1.p1  ORF type:complete len:643 (+),score=68.62 TRINITY_DN703_c0_g1_i1:246-2174(+)